MTMDAVLRERSIADVQKLLDATRREKERKEKEMQAMGGSRYQDLIESADQIVSMHEASIRLEKALREMPALWKTLENSVKACTSKENERAFELNEEIKENEDAVAFIVRAQEKIWAAMERGKALEAWAIYGQIQEKMTLLNAETWNEMGFLAFDKETIDRFPIMIQRCAEKCLVVPKQQTRFFADALQALYLLKPATSLDDLQKAFFDGRTQALERLIDLCKSKISQVYRLLHLVLSATVDMHKLFIQDNAILTQRLKGLPVSNSPAIKWIKMAFTELRKFVEELLSSSHDVSTLGTIQGRIQRCLEQYDIPTSLVVQAISPTSPEHTTFWSLALEDLFVTKTQNLFQGSLENAGAKLRLALAVQPSEDDVITFVTTLTAMFSQADTTLHPVLQDGTLRLLFGIIGFIEKSSTMTKDLTLVQVCLALQQHTAQIFPTEAFAVQSIAVPSIRSAYNCQSNKSSIELNQLFQVLKLNASWTPVVESLFRQNDDTLSFSQVVMLCLLQQRHVPNVLVVSTSFEVLAHEVCSIYASQVVTKATLPLGDILKDQYFGYSNEEWKRVYRPYWSTIEVEQEDEDDGFVEKVTLPWSETPAISYALFLIQSSIVQTTPATDKILHTQLRTQILEWTFHVMKHRIDQITMAKQSHKKKPPLNFGEACALQSIFDIYFVRLCIGDMDFTRFGWGDTIQHPALQDVATALVRDWIDPVDWEIYGPPLTSNVVAQFQTSRLLLSVLTPSVPNVSKVVPHSTLVVDMEPCAPRFSLLPVPTNKPVQSVRVPTPLNLRPASPKRSSIHSLLSTSSSSLLGSAAAAKGMSLLTTASSYLRDHKE
ncbi:hypothetical protein THRCLA_00725 [Thraustotheca clavata]|uniref:Conserved oligomeric Golgi complex subunit 1 n=1 Tax=Thraustotheca clavata TaxID=74557 RepID=A0A1W0AAD0_9STRA|nr:hypothetical protein THRCLA_00725 [Thraustotheca clavata]